MECSARRAAQFLSIGLIAMVVTQSIYIAMSNAEMEINRPLIWTVEAMGFLVITICASILLVRDVRHAMAWAAIMVGGLLNVIQVGMGIAMFPPLKEAGEAMAPAFSAVLAGAFFLYFAGKGLFGFAALYLGLETAAREGGVGTILGWLAALIGIGACVVNVYAMAVGMEMTYIAGAIGTVATLMLALVLGRAVSD